jgi:hypothetical protein
MPNLQADLVRLLLPHRPCSHPCPLVCGTSVRPTTTSAERETKIRERLAAARHSMAAMSEQSNCRKSSRLTFLCARPRRAGDGAGAHGPPRLPNTSAACRCLPPSSVLPRIAPPPTDAPPRFLPPFTAAPLGRERA